MMSILVVTPDDLTTFALRETCGIGAIANPNLRKQAEEAEEVQLVYSNGSVRLMKSKAKEEVNHPDHYGGKDNPYEVIKVLEAWLTRAEFIGYCKGCIIKYQSRADKKGGATDYAKAAWYGNYLSEFVKRIGV